MLFRFNATSQSGEASYSVVYDLGTDFVLLGSKNTSVPQLVTYYRTKTADPQALHTALSGLDWQLLDSRYLKTYVLDAHNWLKDAFGVDVDVVSMEMVEVSGEDILDDMVCYASSPLHRFWNWLMGNTVGRPSFE